MCSSCAFLIVFVVELIDIMSIYIYIYICIYMFVSMKVDQNILTPYIYPYYSKNENTICNSPNYISTKFITDGIFLFLLKGFSIKYYHWFDTIVVLFVMVVEIFCYIVKAVNRIRENHLHGLSCTSCEQHLAHSNNMQTNYK